MSARLLKFTAILATAGLLCAFGGEPMYEPPAGDVADVAVIKAVTSGHPDMTKLVSIDGKACGVKGKTTMTPGEHTIGFVVSHAYLRAEPVAEADSYEHALTFEAKAGHTYVVKSDAARDTITVWIEDEATGERLIEDKIART